MGVESPVIMIVRGRIKLDALLVGKRRKVREKSLGSFFHTVFLHRVSASSPSLPAQGGGAELLGAKLSSGGSGDYLDLLLWLVPLAVPFLA